jgi:hypothetical protein
MIRWWDRWLRGIENGVDEEPSLALFIQRSTAPEPDLAEMRGEWRFEAGWPPARLRERELALPAGAEETLRVRGDVGTAAHIRGSYDPPYGLPLDQRADDAYSLVYEWPVTEELEILGNPRLEATLRSSHPVAFLSAKLSEVLDDGTSVLVSRGIVNLTHRDSHTAPEPLIPGETYEVSLEMDATSRVFEAGHTIRLAIAGSDWPNAWPPPEACELTIVVDRTRLVLPTIVGESPIQETPTFAPVPQGHEAPPPDEREPERPIWRIEHDVYARQTRVVVHQVTTHEEPGRSSWWSTEDVRAGVQPLAPGTAWVESDSETEISWPEVTARAKARLRLRSDATTYSFDLRLEVHENGELVRERRWDQVTPRTLQ